MAKKKKSDISSIDVFKVRSRSERGHWRSGKYWGTNFVEVSAGVVTDAMLADPRLEIEVRVEAVQTVIDGGKE